MKEYAVELNEECENVISFERVETKEKKPAWLLLDDLFCDGHHPVRKFYLRNIESTEAEKSRLADGCHA